MAFKSARKKAGKGLQETADYLGLSKQAVNAWERGACEPSIESLRKMAAFYGCTIDELLAEDTPAGGGRSA